MEPADSSRVAAAAGRRIDAEGAQPPCFPNAAVPGVGAEVRRLLASERIGTVVASAACGADIVALEAGASLGLHLVIVLPFAAQRFRGTSVVDRGGDWGERFDALLARPGIELIELQSSEGPDDAAYAEATERIVAEAHGRSIPGEASLAIAIWEGTPRAGTDATKDFIDRAIAAGMQVHSVVCSG